MSPNQQNPFAYYTAAITNSFTRVLNLEKKNQIIRDDILEAAGLMPSFTRQTENELKSGKMQLHGKNGPVITFTADELTEAELEILTKEKEENED